MRIVVDFPAPLGPRKPSTSPRSTEKEIPSTARFAPKAFAKLWTLIIVNYSASESRRMVEITNFDSVVNWFLRPVVRSYGFWRMVSGYFDNLEVPSVQKKF